MKLLPKPYFLLTIAAFLWVASDSSNASAREFEKRFDGTIKGGSFSISNVLITCDTDDTRCDGAKNFTNAFYKNDPFEMVNVDVDSDASTFNSSTADLALPSDATILHAELYWSGVYTDSGAPHKFTAPLDASKKNEVLFKVPDGNYVTVVGDVDEDAEGLGFYQGHADVTSLINGSGTYGIANVQLTTGKHMYGGWTLVVIVESDLEPYRRVVLWDGFLRNENGSNGITLPNTLGDGEQEILSADLNVVLYDGDKANNDSLLVDGNLFVPKNPNPTTDPAAAGDFGNSSITKFGERFEDRNPFYKNTLGYDNDVFDILPLLDTNFDVELEFKTGADVIHIGVIGVQSEIEPEDDESDHCPDRGPRGHGHHGHGYHGHGHHGHGQHGHGNHRSRAHSHQKRHDKKKGKKNKKSRKKSHKRKR